MTVSASDFFESAQAMLANGSNIDLRNAISRSYYAAYHDAIRVADQFCEDVNSNSRMGSHERLSERFKGCAAFQKGKAWAYTLQYLKMWRHKADYHLNDKVSQTDAETHVRTAERFLRELAETSDVVATG